MRVDRDTPSGLILLAALLAGGCDSGTGGRPVLFDLRLGMSQPEQTTFTTSTGWTVILDQACMAVGPVYLLANPPHLAAAGPPRGLFARVADWLVPAAHAHEGDEHYAGGEVRGEWVDQAVVSSSGGELRLSGLNGLAGPFRSFSARLDPPAGDLADDDCLRGHHAYASGTATRGEAEVAFEGALDIAADGGKRAVEGLSAEGDLDDGSTVTVQVNLANWFDQADFSALDETAPSGRRLVTPRSQVGSAWFIGARDARSFTLGVEPALSKESP